MVPYAWLALLMAASAASAPETPPGTASTDGLSADQVLAKLAAAYATCRSYRDSGVVSNAFDPQHVDVKPFRTAFVRPDQFRFEFEEARPGLDPSSKNAYIIWAKAGAVRTWWYVKPAVERSSSLADAISSATGVSSGSAHTIAALLMPDRIRGAKPSSMTDLTRLPDETVDGAACFKLAGRYGFGKQPRTVWIERATYLIRRIVDEKRLATATTVYKPQVNTEIPATELAFDAPKRR